MKRWHKVLIAIAAFLLAIYLLVFYINHTFIPVKLKTWLVKNISEYTKREAEIGSLQFSLSKGFILNDIKIYKGPKEDKALLFKAEKISFAVIFLPSFKKHTVIIPHISLYEPYLDLERFTDGTWGISSLLKTAPKDGGASRLNLAVKGLSFNNGILSFKDSYEARDFQKTISALNGSIGLSLPDSLSLTCSGEIDKTPIKIISRYRPSKKDLSINLDVENLAFAEYWNKYLGVNTEDSSNAKIYSGICDGFLKLDISGFETIRAKTDISIQRLKADIKDVTLTGNYKLEGTAVFNAKEPLNYVYDLRLGLNKAKLLSAFKSIKEIDNIEGAVSLSEKLWSAKKLSCLIYNSPVIISGDVRRPHKDFIVDANIESSLSLKGLSDILKIDFESGQAELAAKILYKKDTTYQISGLSQIKNLKFRQKDITISGDFSISGESSGTANDWESLIYKGNMTFDNAAIEGFQLLPLISKASGETAFSTKQIIIKKFAGVAADTNIFIKGSVDYKEKAPYISLGIKADDISFPKLISTLPENFKVKLKDIKADGNCSVDVSLTGTASRPETYDYRGKISLKDSSFNISSWPYNVSNISCNIGFEKQKITWQNLKFDIKGTGYESDGTLVDFAQPMISADIKSQNLNFALELKTDNNIINMSKLAGKYYDSSFSVGGQIKDIKTAAGADISGTIYLNLKDMASVFSQYAGALNKINPTGTAKLTFGIQGPLKSFADCALFVEGVSDSIYIGDLRLNDFYFDLRMKDRFIDIPVIAAYPYGGIINISSRINLKTEEKPYIINIDIKDVDLHQLVEESKLKDKKIKGALAVKSVLNGYLGQKDSLQGNGWLQIADGYLWEFPVIRGITELIFMMPPEYMVLTDAFGNFLVRNGRIHTEDFKILSKAVSLLWVGSLGLDGTLDFNITGRFAEDVIKQTTEPGKIASAILHEAGNLIMEVKLTGTLKKPDYRLVPFPVKRIFKEKIVDKFKDIFGNILE